MLGMYVNFKDCSLKSFNPKSKFKLSQICIQISNEQLHPYLPAIGNYDSPLVFRDKKGLPRYIPNNTILMNNYSLYLVYLETASDNNASVQSTHLNNLSLIKLDSNLNPKKELSLRQARKMTFYISSKNFKDN